MDLRAGREVLEKKKECPALAGIRTPDRPARSFVTILSYPDQCSV